MNRHVQWCDELMLRINGYRLWVTDAIKQNSVLFYRILVGSTSAIPIFCRIRKRRIKMVALGNNEPLGHDEAVQPRRFFL
ncbi:MAG: hypothetical protein F6K16_43230 [Symploca sp. SIO2B6]|nr:hypothetical protein [Symploca sp. SIO2B6]